jgi:hypothetical protein
LNGDGPHDDEEIALRIERHRDELRAALAGALSAD